MQCHGYPMNANESLYKFNTCMDLGFFKFTQGCLKSVMKNWVEYKEMQIKSICIVVIQ